MVHIGDLVILTNYIYSVMIRLNYILIFIQQILEAVCVTPVAHGYNQWIPGCGCLELVVVDLFRLNAI